MIKKLLNWMMMKLIQAGKVATYMTIIGVVFLAIIVIKAWRSGLLTDDEDDIDFIDEDDEDDDSDN